MPIATINPATGKTVRTFEPHVEAEVERRITEAHAAVALLRETTFAQRGRWMYATAELLEADAEAVAQTLTLEMGKPIAQARAEVQKSANALSILCRQFRGVLGIRAAQEPVECRRKTRRRNVQAHWRSACSSALELPTLASDPLCCPRAYGRQHWPFKARL